MMSQHLKRRVIQFGILLSYLIIIFIPKMPCNMIIIGFNEFESLSNLNTLKYENIFWIAGLILILIGQIFWAISIIISEFKRIRTFSTIGLIFLIGALIVIGAKNTIDYGNTWLITILTSLPFCGLTLYYLTKAKNDKTLPPANRPPSNVGGGPETGIH
jgi:hypothetical protein